MSLYLMPDADPDSLNAYVVNVWRDGASQRLFIAVWKNAINLNGEITDPVVTIKDWSGNVVATGTPESRDDMLFLEAQAGAMSSSRRYYFVVTFNHGGSPRAFRNMVM